MTVYRIVIDQALCSGFGACADLAPDQFDLGANGTARARTGETGDDAVLDAASACPMGAISVFELATGKQAA